jgi:hypothetical protein
MRRCGHGKKESKSEALPTGQRKSEERIPPLNLSPQMRRKRRGK